MALCEKCANYDSNYADFRKKYDDYVIIKENQKEKDFCVMYEDYIPIGITYNNENCPYYIFRGNDHASQSNR